MGKPRVHKKTELQIEFGSRLKEKRRELGFTQEELAEKADIESTYLSSIERGERNVSLGNVIALAQALDIPVNTLIPNSINQKKMQERIQRKIEFGKCLKEMREKRGWTQEKLAEKADLTSKYIDFLERGEKDILLENAVDFARILKIPLEKLIPESEV